MDYILDVKNNTHIKQGDTCLIYISDHLRFLLTIDEANLLNTKFGTIRASDLVGHPYGRKFQCRKGWILPLRLTPEFWTQMLPHRTQILYQTDISMILLQLDIKPGSIVVESGTGSGSLSHSILRACQPNGFLHTFDINESRVKDATEEFADHGYNDHVRVTHRNICIAGYGDELKSKADACILDLPQTWSAIEHAHAVLKPGGSRLCSFSPCIEQVQRTVQKLNDFKFQDITTLEVLLRPLDVKCQTLKMWSNDIIEDPARYMESMESEKSSDNNHTSKKARMDDRDMDVSSQNQEDESKVGFKRETQDYKFPDTHRLPVKHHLAAKQSMAIVSHSGYLTFATKWL